MSRQFTRDFFFEVSRGNVPGASKISKFGENPDINIASGYEVIWDGGGDYVPPTVARIHDIASTLAVDAGTVISSGAATGGSTSTLIDTGATFVTDSVAVGDAVLNDTNMSIGFVTAVTSQTELAILGRMRNPSDGRTADANESTDAYRIVRDASTGASIYFIFGLDANFAEQEEFVVTNGQTNVPTTGSYKRQNRARVFATASSGAVGVITATAQTDGTVSSQIIDGNNQTLMSIFTVPFGKTGYIIKWWGSISKKQTAVCNVRLRVGILDGVGYVNQSRSITSAADSAFDYDFASAESIPGGADIWVESNTDTNSTGVSSGFDIILIDD